MFKSITKRLMTVLLAIMLVLSMVPTGIFTFTASAATTVTVLDGKITITDTATNMSQPSNGVVTAKAKGGLFGAATNTVTITNTSSETATISFDYVAEKYASFTINGDSSAASGTISLLLENNATIEMYIKSGSGFSASTAALTLSNFDLKIAASSSKVTFNYDNTLGSITVGGESVASGTVKEIELAGAEIIATPKDSSVKFAGWVNAADGTVISTAAKYTYQPASDITVKAIFLGANSKPHFMLGSLVSKTFKYGLLNLGTATYWTVPSPTHIFDDLNAAGTASANSSSKGIVLMNDSTLPAGTYTVPSGSVLLIPFDANNTLYKTEVEGRGYRTDLDGNGAEEDATSERNRHTITYYRTLTMAKGANIILNGEMSLSAKHLWAQGSAVGGGAPCDAVSLVVMQEGSNITINNGGALYTYGFITGSGSVTAKNGATVYEYFQITDFRGGTQSTDMDNGVFPISQYYVQNIEVPLTLEYGAKECSFTTLYMQNSAMASAVNFIGKSGSMFNLTSGYVVKRYDGTKDRIYIELSGDMTVSPAEFDMGLSSINSADYDLGVNGNYTIKVNTGSTITMGQDIALLPGSEIIIAEGATCTLSDGVSVYVYDADQWGNFTSATNKKFIPVVNAPGRKYNRTEADLVDAKIQLDGVLNAGGGYVYTTAGGANIFSTGTGKATVAQGTQTITHQLVQNVGYTEISITPVKFKNADGSYLTSKDNTYVYLNGKWQCEANHKNESVVTEPSCNSQGFTTHTCTVCGKVVVDSYVNATHNYESVVTPPTCDAEGYTTYTCTLCGHSEVKDYVAALGHSYSKVVTAPTCTAKGYTTYTCACGHSYVADYVDTIDHTYESVVTPPTCTEQGFTTHTCSVCGHSYVDTYTAVKHNYSNEFTIDVQPTDLNEGSKSRHCANCDSVTEVTLVPALTEFTATVVDGKVTVTGYKATISGRFNIPETLDGQKVVAIADGTFANQTNLSIVEIPNSVTNISSTAFSGCTNLLAVNYYGTIADWKNVTVGEGAVSSSVRINYLLENIGDLNNDEKIDASDLAYLITYILDGGELSEVEAYKYDINADYNINLLDLARFKRYFAGDYAYLGHATSIGVEEKVALYMASPQGDSLMAASNEEGEINNYETFLVYSDVLEQIAYFYMIEVDPSVDPIDLYIKYIRTGVDRYNSASWGIMAGYENVDFAAFVKTIETVLNDGVDPSEWVYMDALKNIKNFNLPNGDYVDFGHMFGTMDMTNHNKGSINHADVGGWAGDIVDLLTAACDGGVTGTLEEMVAEISKNYLNKTVSENGSFSQTDMFGDLDALYIMNELDVKNYFYGDITALMIDYFTESLTIEDRAAYFINSRMNGVSLRSTLREEVYNTYIGNMVITTLEGTRELNSTNLADLRKACCYAFADYICKLAGDYVDSIENKYFNTFSTTSSILAPGIVQEKKFATTADNKQIAYYLATADLTRDDVNLYANYNNNNPAAGWDMQTVLEQANAAQNKYGNPESEHYIENYNVIVSTNGSGYDMYTGEPSGLLVMGGVEYHPISASGFVGVLKNGKPVIGTAEEYNTIYKDQVAEGIAIFGATLVKDGKIAVAETSNYYSDRASRTAIGFTKTGKVVMMVLDGRQEPISCGGSMIEIAQIMLDAGCVQAVNLDGGGSTTFVSKAEGEDELAVVNRPSDGYARSVSTSFMIVSTAPSSTAFDHAVIESDYDYLTVNSSINLMASGVSATGNAAELPEGTSWAVSDTSIAEIDQNGVLTAKAEGSVNVFLMLGEEAIAVKSIGVVIPDNIYFTKKSVNAVYGSKVELPIKLTYMAKPVKYNVNDVVLSMNNTAAGIFEGLIFIGDENGNVKNVTITAALAVAAETSNTMSISLFSQGEAVFDFEQATGGDKEMAWDRVVSNSTTQDNVIYHIVDKNTDMVTSYTFAIDMSNIGIPEQIADLTYMLPGASSGTSTAWGFLCQLAERVSPLTEVKATIKFDSNFIVDYEKLTIVNDYFTHTATEFDEETNTLTIILKWIDQTEAIDTTMANPICIVSGIKLTPKDDAAWSADGKLSIVNDGEISYDIYLRANALYTFAVKEENQQIYGLYPFINPDDESEKGGHYSATYKEFADNYTLIGALKNGWANEDGGFVYYVEGERLTGVNLVDDCYYDFGENGVNAGKTPYTGIFYDTTISKYRYAKIGVLQTGWHMIDGDWYYYRLTTQAAEPGYYTVNGLEYHFEENGKLTAGIWLETEHGWRYNYGPAWYGKGWAEIDGDKYFFDENYCRVEGIYCLRAYYAQNPIWYEFDENGALISQLTHTGFYVFEGNTYYLINGVGSIGITLIDGDYYYFHTSTGIMAVDNYILIYETNGLVPEGSYYFNTEGKMAEARTGIYSENGGLYYYVNGKLQKGVGMIKIDEDYYFVRGDGSLATGVFNTYRNNGYMPEGIYFFDYETGKLGELKNGVYAENGGLYFYKDSLLQKNAGLVKYEGYYYFVKEDGSVATGEYNTNKNNGLMPDGVYTFDTETGKMTSLKNGIFAENGALYFYKDNAIQKAAGMIKIGDDYYFVRTNGTLATGYYTTYNNNGLMPEGEYYFDPATGKLNLPKNGIVTENGGLYYYIDDELQKNAGMIKIGEDYYFVKADGSLATGAYVTDNNNGLMPEGKYYFDLTTGKMGTLKDGILSENGTLYYYKDNVLQENAGLIKIEDDYYFVKADGSLATGIFVTDNNNGLMPEGKYYFDLTTGKMGTLKDGIVSENGGLFYYKDNVLQKSAGMIKIGEDYYFVRSNGALATGAYNTYNNHGLMPDGVYYFDPATGKMGELKNGIFAENGGLYYYENNTIKKGAGMIKIGEDYYFVRSNGALATGAYNTYNNHGLMPDGVYYFDPATGKMGELKTGIFAENGGLYYYENNTIKKGAGMIVIDGDYYFVRSNGALATGAYNTYNNHGLMPDGVYYFDPETGKMTELKNGIYNENGALYYYENGNIKKGAGMVKIEEDYYFVRSNGTLATGFYNTYNNHGLMPDGIYEFDAETGKLIVTVEEIIAENGGLYYYKNGVLQKGAGMIKIGEDYYFVRSNGALATGEYNTYNNHGLKPDGVYEFDLETGKLIG